VKVQEKLLLRAENDKKQTAGKSQHLAVKWGERKTGRGEKKETKKKSEKEQRDNSNAGVRTGDRG